MNQILPKFDSAVIIPVPTATTRLRERGYDHAKLLAKELSWVSGMILSPALARINQTRQVGATRQQRLSQLKGAFRVKSSINLKGRHVLLVDDVVTSGGTLESAAWTLKQAGAKTVDAVVFAQK